MKTYIPWVLTVCALAIPIESAIHLFVENAQFARRAAESKIMSALTRDQGEERMKRRLSVKTRARDVFLAAWDSPNVCCGVSDNAECWSNRLSQLREALKHKTTAVTSEKWPWRAEQLAQLGVKRVQRAFLLRHRLWAVYAETEWDTDWYVLAQAPPVFGCP